MIIVDKAAHKLVFQKDSYFPDEDRLLIIEALLCSIDWFSMLDRDLLSKTDHEALQTITDWLSDLIDTKGQLEAL